MSPPVSEETATETVWPLRAAIPAEATLQLVLLKRLRPVAATQQEARAFIGASVKVSEADIEKLIEQARQKGLAVSERGCNLTPLTPPVEVEDAKPTLLPSCHRPPNVWIVGVQTRSVANMSKWKGRNTHTRVCRAAVSQCFGPSLGSLAVFAEHYHAGGSLRLVFTRLAPRRLDRGNVSAALKAVEDALALLLGADDGDARWLASYEQETSERYGVRIKLECGT